MWTECLIILSCVILWTPASVAITTIYADAGMSRVHLPCIALETAPGGTTVNPEVESMWAHYNSSGYRMVTVTDKDGTTEKFRQPILGGDTIYPNASFKNEQFFGRVNVSADRGLIIRNVQSSDAGKFLCRYKDTKTKDSDSSEVELIVYEDIPTSKPRPTSESVKDNPNTEASCDLIFWQAAFGVVSGLLAVGVLLQLCQYLKTCHHSAAQTGGGSFELVTGQNNKGEEESQVEAEATNDVDGNDDDLVSEL